jgi:hypothetical protein
VWTCIIYGSNQVLLRAAKIKTLTYTGEMKSKIKCWNVYCTKEREARMGADTRGMFREKGYMIELASHAEMTMDITRKESEIMFRNILK